MNNTIISSIAKEQSKLLEDMHANINNVIPATGTNHSSKRNDLRVGIKPEVDLANGTMSAIYKAYTDNCNGYKKFKQMKQQIKNWEKQLRGACEQIITIVQALQFDAENAELCSPMAWHTIQDYDSRDRSSLDLVAAIMVFYNSLTDEEPEYMHNK